MLGEAEPWLHHAGVWVGLCKALLLDARPPAALPAATPRTPFTTPTSAAPTANLMPCHAAAEDKDGRCSTAGVQADDGQQPAAARHAAEGFPPTSALTSSCSLPTPLCPPAAEAGGPPASAPHQHHALLMPDPVAVALRHCAWLMGSVGLTEQRCWMLLAHVAGACCGRRSPGAPDAPPAHAPGCGAPGATNVQGLEDQAAKLLAARLCMRLAAAASASVGPCAASVPTQAAGLLAWQPTRSPATGQHASSALSTGSTSTLAGGPSAASVGVGRGRGPGSGRSTASSVAAPPCGWPVGGSGGALAAEVSAASSMASSSAPRRPRRPAWQDVGAGANARRPSQVAEQRAVARADAQQRRAQQQLEQLRGSPQHGGVESAPLTREASQAASCAPASPRGHASLSPVRSAACTRSGGATPRATLPGGPSGSSGKAEAAQPPLIGPALSPHHHPHRRASAIAVWEGAVDAGRRFASPTRPGKPLASVGSTRRHGGGGYSTRPLWHAASSEVGVEVAGDAWAGSMARLSGLLPGAGDAFTAVAAAGGVCVTASHAAGATALRWQASTGSVVAAHLPLVGAEGGCGRLALGQDGRACVAAGRLDHGLVLADVEAGRTLTRLAAGTHVCCDGSHATMNIDLRADVA